MTAVLTLSLVAHVVSAALWTGSVLYAVYTVVPAARAGELAVGSYERTVDGLLTITRWTGIVLPVTGAYQAWVLYPLPRLVGTTRGYLVVGMAVLWTLMNGAVELGVLRMRTVDGDVNLGRYLAEGFGVDGGIADGAVRRSAEAGRPYLLAAAALATLLLVDAGLLSGPL